jgi:hypothetical protein
MGDSPTFLSKKMPGGDWLIFTILSIVELVKPGCLGKLASSATWSVSGWLKIAMHFPGLILSLHLAGLL